jgi:hypothetical protein
MVKWMAGTADANLVALAKSVGSLTVMRVYWPEDRQNRGGLDDYLKAVERAILAHPGIDAFEVSFNEAHQSGDDLAWKAAADIRGMELCERHGKRAVIGCFSVGMPDPAEWPRYLPALARATAGGHYLGLHEYGGGSAGMRAMVEGDGPTARGWAFLRHRRVLDWARAAGVRMPRILITEAGIDVLAQADRPTRGYQTVTDAVDYPTQLRWCSERLAETPEVVGWCDFGWSADDPQWWPFDLSRDGPTLARVQTLQAALPDTGAMPKPQPGGTMADLNAMLVAEFGETYSDLRSALPSNPHGPFGDFSPRPMGGIDMIAVHHTAGPKAQGWTEIAQFHVTNRQWAGIGYHIGIRGGRVSYLGDVSRGRACCMDQNHRVICVCLTGDYEREALDPADAGALMRVVDVIQRWARVTVGKTLAVKGHREVPGQQTACPGRNLLPLVYELAGGTAAPPSRPVPPVQSGPNFVKVVWFLEDMQRRMEREGYAAESRFVGANYTADAVRRRATR